MYKSRNFKVETDVRLRILEQQLKAQADELKEVKAKLISQEEKLLRQVELEAQLKLLTETVNELNTKLTSAQSAAPELPGGMTPEEAVQEIYRMCGLGDDK